MYLALYRKYRPKKFSDVVGQKYIVKTLVNQIISDRVSHAYLFCGTRGTGKTSIAKIFAMAVNCFCNKNGEPCMKCESCRNILNKQDSNIIEIDAASNNGVDNIRDIRDEVKYPPVNSKYKIYIVDEVHMLSSGAFNALLKTLEEPPAHVIFILATTDPQKIPATILSRCQRFDFKRLLPNEMSSAIKKYMEEENVNISNKAINYITHISDGAMRDALSVLDQCISFYFGEEITLKKITEIIGTVDYKICAKFINLLANKEIDEILAMINKIIMDGKDITQFLSTLMAFLRDVIIIKNIGKNEKILDLSSSSSDILKECKLDFEDEIKLLELFSNLQNNLKYAVNPKILFEIACIKFCSTNQNEFEKRSTPVKKTVQSEKIPVPKKKIVPNNVKELIEKWPKIISQTDGLLKEILNLSYIGSLKKNTVYIITNDPGSNLFLKQKKVDIKNLISNEFNYEFDLDFIFKDDYDTKHKIIYGQEDENLKKQLLKINTDVIVEE